EIGKGLLRTMILRLSRATEGAVDSLETMYGMIQSQVGPAGPDRK
ncbi:MAG: hypothetical protein HY718_11655, partial [Planctomycetes bacterium]|nr:hypothetical protein [Planctomycetota bacterium]